MNAIKFTEKGIEFISYKKKQKNSRFNKLQKRAEKIEFILEKCGNNYIPYEIVSNIRDIGTTICCRNLNEVEDEILNLEERFSQH